MTDIWQFSVGLKPDVALFLLIYYVPPHTTAAHQKVELDINLQLPCQLLKNQKDFQVFWLRKELQSNTAERGEKRRRGGTKPHHCALLPVSNHQASHRCNYLPLNNRGLQGHSVRCRWLQWQLQEETANFESQRILPSAHFITFKWEIPPLITLMNFLPSNNHSWATDL